MAHIAHYLFLSHLRAQPNEFILHYKNGRLKISGGGLSYWFIPVSASIVQLPVEDREATFLLGERTSDLQEVEVQISISFRIDNPEVAAKRVNFSLDPATGRWTEKPFDRLTAFWMQRAQEPARAYLMKVGVEEAVRSGPREIQSSLDAALRGDAQVAAMGLSLVNVQVTRVAATAEVGKALLVPAREAIQQRADEATFQRRALAVEKERAISENELATKIELAKRQEVLVRQNGANELLQAQQAAEKIRTNAEANATARRLSDSAALEGEARRLDTYASAPAKASLALTMQQFAQHLQTIQHLNVTPDMMASLLQQFLQKQNAE